MFSPVTLLFFLSSVVLCLTAESTETTMKNTVVTLSDSEILLTVTACTTAPVLVVLLPMLIYYKFCKNDLLNQVV